MVELDVRKIRDYSYHQLRQLVKKSDKADLPYLLKDVQKELHEKNGEKNIAQFPHITGFPYQLNSYEEQLYEENVYIPLLEDIKKLEALEKEIRLKLNKATTNATESPQIPQEILEALEKEKLIKIIEISPLVLEWKGAKNLCAYFVDCYFAETNPNNLWEVGKSIFKIKKDDNLSEIKNLAQLKDYYMRHNTKTGKPKRFEVIDRILQDYERNKATNKDIPIKTCYNT